jgi:hypothetical protein
MAAVVTPLDRMEVEKEEQVRQHGRVALGQSLHPSVPEPHVYDWLGNDWVCLRCNVQIRNQDCPYNAELADCPVNNEGPSPSVVAQNAPER